MTNRSKGLFFVFALVLIAAATAPEPSALTHHSPGVSKIQFDKRGPRELPRVQPMRRPARAGAVVVEGSVHWTGRHQETPASDVPAAGMVQTIVSPRAPDTSAAAIPIELRGPSIAQPPVMPFAYLGQVTQSGERKALLLDQGRPLVVAVGGKVGSSYTLLAMQPGELVFRYEPWGVEQLMSIRTIDEADETVIRN